MAGSRKTLKQYFYVGVGLLSLGLGILGIILPVLPTTPFLLLSAACFARGSERFYNWLLAHPWFGQSIRDYREGGGIRRSVKYKAIGLLWLTISLSVIFVVNFVWAQVAMLLTATLVSVFLWTRPTPATERIDSSPSA